MLLLIIKYLIFIICITLLTYFFLLNKSIKMEKRISNYSVESLKEENKNLVSFLQKKHNSLIKYIENSFSDTKYLKNSSNRYDKYVLVGDELNIVNFIIDKVLLGFLFDLLFVISLAFQDKIINIFELIIGFVIGYYMYDLYLYMNKKIKLKRIQNDILRAVIIMNNAFKSGKSIMQAVEIASKELPNPIKGEFEKIYQDLIYGLSTDVVFERFAKRIKLQEANYISSSLIILNKTGGNIIKVFDSIERTLLDRKKLETELKNATAASNLVVKVLTLIPIVFILVIKIISPDYFKPFFENSIGYASIIFIVILFMSFIYTVNKVMKVKV